MHVMFAFSHWLLFVLLLLLLFLPNMYMRAGFLWLVLVSMGGDGGGGGGGVSCQHVIVLQLRLY